MRNHSQSLERLNERGGLSPQEMLAIMDGKLWEERLYRDESFAHEELKRRVVRHRHLNFYLAARYSRRDELRVHRDMLVALGHTCMASWLDTAWPISDTGSTAAPDQYREHYAIKEALEVRQCNMLIAFTEEPRSSTRGGRHVEFGIALGMGKRVVVIGQRENLFYYHPDVTAFNSFQEFLDAYTRQSI